MGDEEGALQEVLAGAGVSGRAPPRLGVALSGGGYRSTLFSLGVLAYLVDSGASRHVVAISSVSGGSYTNAYAATIDFPKTNFEEFREAVVAPLLRGTTRPDRRIWLRPRMIGGGALMALALAAVRSESLHPAGRLARLWTRSAALCAFHGLYGKRGEMIAGSVRRALFPDWDSRLSDLGANGIDHVFCATNLHSGKLVYFAPRFVYDPFIGWHAEQRGQDGKRPFERLDAYDDVISASAAIPVIFPPVSVDSKIFGRNGDGAVVPERLLLADGGLYDNMAEQWLLDVGELGRRSALPAESAPRRSEGHRPHVPNTFVVVNSHKELRWRQYLPYSTLPVVRKQVPVALGLSGLARSTRILAYGSTERRIARLRSAFRRSFDLEAEAPRRRDDLVGTFIGVDASPLRVPHAILRRRALPPHQEEARERARTVRRRLLGFGEDWAALVKRNSAIATPPHRIDSLAAEDLFFHGYMSAWANIHTLLGSSADPGIASRAHFRRRWLTASEQR